MAKQLKSESYFLPSVYVFGHLANHFVWPSSQLAFVSSGLAWRSKLNSEILSVSAEKDANDFGFGKSNRKLNQKTVWVGTLIWDELGLG